MNRIIRTDGGREAAGYAGGSRRDCVVRAIAIAAQRPYDVVHRELSEINAGLRMTKKRARIRGGLRRSPSEGTFTKNKPTNDYMARLGFRWVPTMTIGSGCKVHLRADELPRGRIIAVVSRHWVAVIDGVLHDTHDASRGGTRCVYGYWELTRR